MNPASIRLFQWLAYGWSALYAMCLLVLGDAAWVSAPVDVFTTSTGLHGRLQWMVNGLGDIGCSILCALVLIVSVLLLLRHRWWLALLLWFLFRLITHRSWLASNGGIQLMENMLLWSAFMTNGSVWRMSTSPFRQLPVVAFWIARLQLVLVYAMTAVHKSIGHSWPNGSAVRIVAMDPDFNLSWLASFPMLCTILTFGALGFMTLFTLAVWWTPSRRFFLGIGVLFHLSTAIFMDIPQMGLAFIACYALWLNEKEANALLGLVR